MWKDVLIGILVAYVIVDMMMAYTLRRSAPSCLEKMVDVASTKEGLVAIVVGIIIGFIAWYFSRRKTDDD